MFRFTRSGIVVLGALVAACGGRDRPEPQPPAEATQPAPDLPAGGVAQVVDGGRIAGTITVSGRIPTLPPRPINKDTQTCGAGARPSEELIVSKAGGLRNAVIVVEGVRGGKPMPSMKAVVDQVKCEYVPHVQAMPAGADLSIINSDPVLHNIHLYRGDVDLFNIAQPTKGQVNTQKIERPGFVYAECDVHGWMRGHIAVVDNPYYAITGEDGRFEIADLPAGTYTVRIWHEYLGEQTRQVTVTPKGEAALNLDLKDLLAKKNPATTSAAPPPAPTATAPAKAPAAAAPTGGALSGDVTINMVSHGSTFAFEPAHVTIKAGTTVNWVNTSDNRHTATDDPKFEKAPGQAALPAGASPWSTPFIANGQNTSYTFTTPGKYQYFCRNHGQFGMVATITVVP